MALLVEGCNCEIQKIKFFEGSPIFLHILQLYPSTKRVITPMFKLQIEKFHCLKSSTTSGLSHGTLRRHVARAMCPQTCIEVSKL